MIDTEILLFLWVADFLEIMKGDFICNRLQSTWRRELPLLVKTCLCTVTNNSDFFIVMVCRLVPNKYFVYINYIFRLSFHLSRLHANVKPSHVSFSVIKIDNITHFQQQKGNCLICFPALNHIAILIKSVNPQELYFFMCWGMQIINTDHSVCLPRFWWSNQM